MSTATPKMMPRHEPDPTAQPSFKQVQGGVEKRPYVPQPNLTQRPLRNHQGLIDLKATLDAFNEK